ncbi:hypothetical protein VTN49DRAFT_4881 [Thermomyces lanuginosus]|uniref:uncharacterized protein n=1 Tax=Thermomyces lanuginosus TaxID=5541 RepID=UPI003742170F
MIGQRQGQILFRKTENKTRDEGARQVEFFGPQPVLATKRSSSDSFCDLIAAKTATQHGTSSYNTDIMVLGRLTHYAFDAVLVSAFLAGIKRSTGLTPSLNSDKITDNQEVKRCLSLYSVLRRGLSEGGDGWELCITVSSCLFYHSALNSGFCGSVREDYIYLYRSF